MTSPVKPMLANGLAWDQIETKAAGYPMEPKLDGWRCIVHVKNGHVELYSRTGKPFTEKVFISLLEQFRSIGSNYIMDGELAYLADERLLITDYAKTASVLGSGPDEAHRKQYAIAEENNLVGVGAYLQFVAFDMLQAGGHSLIETPQGTRTLVLRTTLKDTWESGQPTPEIQYVPQWSMFSDNTYEAIVLAGGEGVVLKNPLASYHPGKRPANVWFKVKKFDTLDVIITGFKPGQGKYTGQVGALEFSLWIRDEEGNPVGRRVMGYCRGFDDGLCRDMTDNFDQYRDTVMEIRHFGQVGKDQVGYRHPQFIRMRPDKDQEECVLI
jgi:ATP-dependent DNA ligase